MADADSRQQGSDTRCTVSMAHEEAARESAPPGADADPPVGGLVVDSEADQARLDQTRILVQQIESVIEPWKQSAEKPPFLPEELLVMALVCTDPEPQSERSVVTWILK
jgi:hypothetical protein